MLTFGVSVECKVLFDKLIYLISHLYLTLTYFAEVVQWIRHVSTIEKAAWCVDTSGI